MGRWAIAIVLAGNGRGHGLPGTSVFVIGAAALTAWLPARRAATIDPVLALRSE